MTLPRVRGRFPKGITPWNKGINLPAGIKARISDTLRNRREKPIPHAVYYLLDPETLAPRYVGVSEDTEKRFLEHLKERGDTHKCRWLAMLRAANLVPVLSIRCIVQ